MNDKSDALTNALVNWTRFSSILPCYHKHQEQNFFSRKPMNGLKKPKQILFRATSGDEMKIRQAAKLRGVSLQKFLLDAAIAATGN